jgi:hypothetical protein
MGTTSKPSTTGGELGGRISGSLCSNPIPRDVFVADALVRRAPTLEVKAMVRAGGGLRMWPAFA